MVKPGGSTCNLDCSYCYYLEKSALYPGQSMRMPDALLERLISDFIAAHPVETPVVFGWQGGEPTLLGLDFFRRVVAFQKRHADGKRIENTLQTNGTLLTAEWCRFLAEQHFLVGISLDGPATIHDACRPDKRGKPSHSAVMRGLELLQAHAVEFNVLACVNRLSVANPLAVYDFLRGTGSRFIQFLPVVEPRPGLQNNAVPPERAIEQVSEWSLRPEEYGRFLTSIFEHWIARDVGQVTVMNFEWALASYMRLPGAMCHHQPVCGRSVVVEHNGDVFACDHFVSPEYRLGNINQTSLASLVDSDRQQAFGAVKLDSLPGQCRKCPMLHGCWGGCPKHRFVADAGGEAGLNYLCASYRHYFSHIAPSLQGLANLIARGRPPAEIMQRGVQMTI